MSEPIVRGLPWKHVLYGMIENSAGILIHPEIDPETVPAVVHCVNCHDQLVAALEAVRAWDRCSAGRTALWWEDVLAKVAAALAAAKVPQ